MDDVKIYIRCWLINPIRFRAVNVSKTIRHHNRIRSNTVTRKPLDVLYRLLHSLHHELVFSL